MNAQWRKEIRLVIPAWLLAAGLPLAALFLFPREIGQGLSTFLVGFGCALLGSSVFGPEFSHGTMEQLLVQPCERRRIWLMKMSVLAAAMAPFLGVAMLAQAAWSQEPAVLLVLFVPLCALCATPALTLLARNGLGATVLTIALPLVLFGIVGGIVSKIYVNLGDNDPEQITATLIRASGVVLSLYCVVACWLGYRLFMRFQVADARARALPLERFVEVPFSSFLNLVLGRRRGAFASLLRKELRLQHAGVLIAVAFTIVLAVVIAILPSLHKDYQSVALLLPVVLLAGIIPLVMGSLAVAEERNLGLHAWQLTLPVPLWKQWLAKLLVTFGGSFAFGVVLPWAALLAGHARLDSVHAVMPDDLMQVVMIALGQALFTALVIHASTLSSTPLRAIMGSIGLVTAAGLSASLLGKLANGLPLWNRLVSPRAALSDWRPVPFLNMEELLVLTGVGLPLVVVLVFAYGNFKSIDISRRRLWGQAAFLIVPTPVFAIFLPILVVILISVLVALWRAP